MTSPIRPLRILASGLLLATLAAGGNAAAVGQGDATASQTAPGAVNTTCPIGKEPIDNKTFTTYKGKTIGFCCPGCDKAFVGWSEERRDDFVLVAMRGAEPGLVPDDAVAMIETGDAEPAPEVESDLYLLDTCPVSGLELSSKGDPVVKTIEGREVRFCCGGCVGRFEADSAAYFKTIDKAIVEEQMPYYPIDTCIVMGDPLVEDGEDIAVNYVYKNRLVRLCCKGCIKDLEAEPAKYLAKLDEAVIKSQGAAYPLQDCAVLEGSKLGSMGDPVEIVVGNRLVKFCCAGCQPKFEANPAPSIARLAAAWKAAHAHDHGDHDGDGHDHDGPDHDGHDHDGHDHD